MVDSRRYIGTGAVLALVLLRLVVGWHFFTQGLEKIEYDPRAGRIHMPFSSSGFLSQAKGPLASFYHSHVPGGHDWQTLLAVPREQVPLADEDVTEQSRWNADYLKRRAEAEKNKEAVPIEFPPFAPYHTWAERISTDWQAVLDKTKAIAALSDEQRRQLDEAYHSRKQQLADFLAGEHDAIVEYQHQLWRLVDWQAEPKAANVPFHAERIAAKAAETGRSSQPWVAQINELERHYLNDLRNILTPEQEADAATSAAVVEAQTSSRASWLNTINVAVTVMTIGVGICLLLGFFTRLASVVGALFLLSVISTQPPWIADAAPTISYAIEFAALLVLAGTGAGRWLGLDFFTYALFHRHDS